MLLIRTLSLTLGQRREFENLREKWLWQGKKQKFAISKLRGIEANDNVHF